MKRTHDSTITKINYDGDEKSLVLYGKTEKGEEISIIFTGAVACDLSDVLTGNILFGIEEENIEKIAIDDSQKVDHWKSYGWPIKENCKVYIITSSWGLLGYIVAEKYEII